jgi:hypothetical protein
VQTDKKPEDDPKKNEDPKKDEYHVRGQDAKPPEILHVLIWPQPNGLRGEAPRLL